MIRFSVFETDFTPTVNASAEFNLIVQGGDSLDRATAIAIAKASGHAIATEVIAEINERIERLEADMRLQFRDIRDRIDTLYIREALALCQNGVGTASIGSIPEGILKIEESIGRLQHDPAFVSAYVVVVSMLFDVLRKQAVATGRVAKDNATRANKQAADEALTKLRSAIHKHSKTLMSTRKLIKQMAFGPYEFESSAGAWTCRVGNETVASSAAPPLDDPLAAGVAYITWCNGRVDAARARFANSSHETHALLDGLIATVTDWATLERFPGTKIHVVSLKANYPLKYISIDSNGIGVKASRNTALTKSEQFSLLVMDPSEKEIALRSKSHGRFLSTDPPSALRGNAALVTLRELFNMEDATPGNANDMKYFLKAVGNDYVFADNTGDVGYKQGKDASSEFTISIV
jgi:hypothetical protein